MEHTETGVSRWARMTFMAYAAAVPVSLVLAEPLAFLSIALGLVVLWQRGGTQSVRQVYWLPALLFLGLAAATVLWSARPADGVAKLHRLVLPGVMFLIPAVFGPEGRQAQAWRMVGCFLGGVVCLAVFDLIRVPIELSRGVGLFHTGNMRDPQIYMVGLLLALVATAWKGRSCSVYWPGLALALSMAGLVLHFKRGVWFSCILALGVMALAAGRKRWLVIMSLCVGLLLAVPQVRERLALLRETVTTQEGGRFAIWTRATPDLLREYPAGMGWHAMRHEDLVKPGVYIQPKLDHLHNNLLQVAVEVGWAGLALWSWWMLAAGGAMYVQYRRWRVRDEGGGWLALGLFGGFLALFLNGMVEYNFGDAEILMLWCLLMGVSGLLGERRTAN